MATLWVNSRAAPGGDGSEGAPFNALPTSLGSNDYLLAAGSVFDMGAAQIGSGNNTTLRKYGTGLDPAIYSSASNAFSSNIATGTVILEDISLIRSGAQGGNGINCSVMGAALGTFIARRCLIAGFNTDVFADRSSRVTLENCFLGGSSTTYGIKAVATSNANCDFWRLIGNTFTGGIAIDLATSNSMTTTGAFNDLVIAGNTIYNLAGAAMNLGCPSSQSNSALYAKVTAPSTISFYTDPGGTVPAALPAWPNGTTLFLAGFSNRANFGLVTVNTNSGGVVVVNEATLLTEALGQNKGMHLRDLTRNFNGVRIEDNHLSQIGGTPMNLNGISNGVVLRNVITDVLGLAKVSACIECINVRSTLVEWNEIRRVAVSSAVQTVDGMGIMFDGAAENCIGRYNTITDLYGLAGVPNSGAGIALFECKNCDFYSNFVSIARSGLWVGGPGTTGDTYNNTFADCAKGFEINSSPAAGAISLKNSLVIDCDVTGTDAATSAPAWIAYWNNLSGSTLGANPLLGDPLVTADYRPRPGSPLLTGGGDLGPVRDMGARQCRGHVGAYGAATLAERA